MQAIIPYLNLAGQAELALAFYQRCFNGDITTMMRFGDNPSDAPIPDELKQKVMHAHFKAGQLEFMASDGMPGEELQPHAGSIELNLNFNDLAEQQKVFDALAENGQVIHPLQDTFWGARFGRISDQYGISWMLNCQL
ncbi:VOC family protein [Aliagarivorans taiwanensis]|uniref:VOC family protein n=1 Tax=Aliagarivorans taiwanensis TaxID=561966 RepID=UPI000401E9D3|nr:VOC family protein [Aliagarivorans taiwanensis]